QTGALTAQQIQGLTSTAVGWLAHPDCLNSSAVGALRADQVPSIFMHNDQAVCWDAFIPASWANPSWLNDLSSAGWSGITSTELHAIKTTAISGLTTAAIGRMPANVFAALSPSQV